MPGFHFDQRLVHEEEFVVHEAAAHVGLELQSRLHSRVHVGGIEAINVAACFLGGIHRRIGLLDQTSGIARVHREYRYADGARQRGRLIAKAEGSEERFADARHHGHDLEGRVRGVEPRQNDHEFVAAQPRHGIGLAHCARQALRNGLQELVACVVTQRVVDALEVIEVQKKASDLIAFPRRLRDDLLQPLVEQHPVGQTREYVVLGELVRLRRRDLELLRSLRDLFLERALVGRDLALRCREPLRHMVECMRQQAELIA